ncbi:hypothetical protein VTL71DRAFT_5773, partial [Oculimacula yallundae]
MCAKQHFQAAVILHITRAEPVPTYESPDIAAATTIAGVAVTPQPSVPAAYTPLPAVESSISVKPARNSTLIIPASASIEAAVPVASTTKLYLTSKIADGIVVTKTIEGVVASTGIIPSSTSCAGPKCTKWISGG